MDGRARRKLISDHEEVMNQRLAAALAAFAVLFALAFVLLHGMFLYTVLILLAGLAAKTLIAHKAGW